MNLTSIAGDIAQVLKRAAVPIDERLRLDGRELRFTSVLDDESQRFEDELLARAITPCHAGIGGNGEPTSEHGRLDLPLQQRHAWLRVAGGEFRLLQVRDGHGQAAMQAAVTISRPRHAPSMARGVVDRLGHAASAAEEQWGLGMLRERCLASGDILTLRLQPRRLGVHALCDIEGRARHAGFSLTDPEGVTRTLLLDLRASGDELLAHVSAKTRRKLRAREGAPIVIRPMLDTRYVAACEEAGLASVRRHGAETSRAPWRPALALATREPTRVGAFGLFLADRPEELAAAVVAQRCGEVAECLSAGSRDLPALRKYPFNYWLLWELTQWARANGARYLDLGGISDGGPDDPLAGIAAFKHHFSENEVEVGREMVATLRPVASWAVRTLKRACHSFASSKNANNDPR
jgi:hypothetical protein